MSLDQKSPVPEAGWQNVVNTPSNQTMATNDKPVWSTGTWTCTPGFQYRARLQWHIDGTSLTGSIAATTPPTNC